jgi:hypothetical protein
VAAPQSRGELAVTRGIVLTGGHQVSRCPRCAAEVAIDGLPACPRHLEAEIGITYRQVDYWTRLGWLKPENPVAGSGVSRRWPAFEVEVARRMGRLAAAGLGIPRAAAFARESWPAGEIAPGVTLAVSEPAS